MGREKRSDFVLKGPQLHAWLTLLKQPQPRIHSDTFELRMLLKSTQTQSRKRKAQIELKVGIKKYLQRLL